MILNISAVSDAVTKNKNNSLNGSQPKIHPDLSFCPDLSYIIGVIQGDGYVCSEGKGNFKIGLNTRDKEFADAFANSLRKIKLNSNVYFNKAQGGWISYAYSKKFYEWWNSFKEIEILSKRFPLDYIRGIYDSEGSFYKYKRGKHGKKYSCICIYNTNYDLLFYVKALLENYGIKAFIYINHKKGYISINKNGKNIELKSDYYAMRISLPNITKFIELIGSSIPRKRGEGKWLTSS